MPRFVVQISNDARSLVPILRGVDLQGANLSRCLLEGANLEGANLVETNLEGAEMLRTYLNRCEPQHERRTG
jgi:uncharacterized protein YjbI with pentapeptide repeats